MAYINVTGMNFEQEVTKSDKPVLIDFWASWCGPCRMLAPTIEEIANERSDIKVCKINVDDAPDIAASFGIMSIPTVVVVKNGNAVGRLVGVQDKQTILNLI